MIRPPVSGLPTSDSRRPNIGSILPSLWRRGSAEMRSSRCASVSARAVGPMNLGTVITMYQRLSVFFLLIAAVGCGTSSKTLGRRSEATTTTAHTPTDAHAVATALCDLPTRSQLSCVLGTTTVKAHARVRRSPGPPFEPTTGCFFVAGSSQLALVRLSVSHPEALQTFVNLVRRGKTGSCRPEDAPTHDLLFGCITSAANSPDFTEAPEITARAFSGRSAVKPAGLAPAAIPSKRC